MDPSTPSSVGQFARVTNLIAGAIAVSVPVYMAIAWLVAPTVVARTGDPGLVRLLGGVLALLSAGHLAAAQLLFAGRVRAAERLRSPEERLAGYRTAVIVASAVREGVALYGLVLSFLSGDARWCLGFGAVALLSMVLGWPRRSHMDRLASEVTPIG